MSETKVRNPYWDIIKGVAAILVIAGHAILSAKGLEDPLFNFINSFHMPLFMIVSGWFFSKSLHHTTKYIIWQKIIYLVLPVLLVGTIDWAIGYLDIHLSIKENLINLFARMLRTLWFLQALFICSVIVLFGERICKTQSWILYVAIILLFLLTPDKLEQHETKMMFPFFVAGLFMKKE